MSIPAVGLIGLRGDTGCKQRPAVVASEKAERKLCFLRKCLLEMREVRKS
ncbi:MAG: hypothetical protein ACOYIB_04065 [Desulfosporosinus sp.]